MITNPKIPAKEIAGKTLVIGDPDGKFTRGMFEPCNVLEDGSFTCQVVIIDSPWFADGLLKSKAVILNEEQFKRLAKANNEYRLGLISMDEFEKLVKSKK